MSKVSLEELEYYKEYFNNQEGRKYPCSNQIVLCGIVTDSRDKAIDFMKNKNIVRKIEARDRIEWILDNNERWLWKYWNESARGYRFYKIAVDSIIDKSLFHCLILPRCANYCCSMEII